MEPDTDTGEPTEDVRTCEVCGATNGNVIELDDGTLYCSAHRGLATTLSTQAETAVGAFTPEEGAEYYREVVAPEIEANAEADAAAAEELPWPMEPAVRMVASLCFTAALATFYEDQTYGDPPTGWAPPPANESPFMEAGVVLAIATLIEAAEIDREMIQLLADVFAGRETTDKGASDE